MIIEVSGEEAEKEQRLSLKLFGTENGVDLAAVDENGERLHCGRILFISEDGIHRAESVGSDLGLPLDRKCRVKLRDNLDASLRETLDRLRRVVDGKKDVGCDLVVTSAGGTSLYLSDLRELLRHFE